MCRTGAIPESAPNRAVPDVEQLRSILSQVKEVVFQTDAEGRWTYLSPAWTEITGFTVAESLGKVFVESVHPDDRAGNLARFQPLIAREKEYCRHEVRYLRKNADPCWMEVHARLTLDGAGKVVGASGTLSDVTARKLVTDELRETAAALQRREMILQAVNSAAERFLRSSDWRHEVPPMLQQLCRATRARRVWLYEGGAARGDGREVAGAWPPETGAIAAEELDVTEEIRVMAGARQWGSLLFQIPAGNNWSESTRHSLKAAADIMGAAIHREQAERELRRGEALHHAMTAASPVGLYVIDSHDNILFVNDRFCELTGLDAVASCIRHRRLSGTDVREGIRRQMTDGPVDARDLLRPDPEGEVVKHEVAMRGGRRLSMIGSPVRDEANGCYGYLFGVEDITAKKAAEEAMLAARDELERRVDERTAELARANHALRESEELYRSVVESSPNALIFADPEGRIAIVNRRAVEIFGLTAAAGVIGKTMGSLMAAESAAAIAAAWDETRRFGLGRNIEFELRRLDGSSFFADVASSTVPSPGSPVRFLVASVRDITRRKQLEEQVRQAQKMDAVGRLAGGVAHDFNNLLTVIKGYSELLLKKLPEHEATAKRVAQIAKAADRAAALVGQLLAFSRKQVVELKVIDVNQAIRDLETMLRRLIGANLEFTCALDPGAGRILIDPTQFDQMVVNLVVNARDAIRETGTITIRTRLVPPDDPAAAHRGANFRPHVSVSVADDGVGMTEEVKSRIFEPFFTTKEVGAGTGLGLATVYGIVQQAGGHLVVTTAPGKGTVMEAQFTAVDGEADRVAPAGTVDPAGGRETILVVEDEDQVRAMIVEALQDRGYTVLEARNGCEAVDVAANAIHEIDLVLTDVVMPRMGGLRLWEEMARIRPHAKVILMSGYWEHGMPEGSWLHKPFDPPTLISHVRRALS